MNAGGSTVRTAGAPSAAARERILTRPGEPLLFAAWERALMIHFEVDADALQPDVPFDLDLQDGRAFVSLVAFTMRGMRSRMGGRLAAWLLRPIATHEFLNVRTYVRHRGEPGIYFLAEWLSNQLAVRLGPTTFGLPYRHGNIAYNHEWHHGHLRGRVSDVATGAALTYRAELPSQASFEPCEADSLTEWLMERYTAFTCRRNRQRFFRVWHPPWPQCEADVAVHDNSLVCRPWPWFGEAQLTGANFSPGLHDVWMGRPWPADCHQGSSRHNRGRSAPQLSGPAAL